LFNLPNGNKQQNIKYQRKLHAYRLILAAQHKGA